MLTENTGDSSGHHVSTEVWHTGPNPKVHGVSVYRDQQLGQFGQYRLSLDGADGKPIDPYAYLLPVLPMQNPHLTAFLKDIMA